MSGGIRMLCRSVSASIVPAQSPGLLRPLDLIEHAIQAGEAEDLLGRSGHADQDEPAVVLAEPLQAGDEGAEAARVHELDPAHVDGKETGAVLDQAKDVIPERGRRVEVELAGDLDHGPSTLRPGPLDDFHRAPPKASTSSRGPGWHSSRGGAASGPA